MNNFLAGFKLFSKGASKGKPSSQEDEQVLQDERSVDLITGVRTEEIQHTKLRYSHLVVSPTGIWVDDPIGGLIKVGQCEDVVIYFSSDRARIVGLNFRGPDAFLLPEIVDGLTTKCS